MTAKRARTRYSDTDFQDDSGLDAEAASADSEGTLDGEDTEDDALEAPIEPKSKLDRVRKGVADFTDLTDLQRGFKARAAREDQRFEDNVDSEFWVCVVFQTRHHKERFLKAMGLWEHGDKYIDGDVLADAIGLEYDKEARRPGWTEKVVPEKLQALSRLGADEEKS